MKTVATRANGGVRANESSATEFEILKKKLSVTGTL